MKKSQYTPEESLERVKLMMGYDVSKTLNENASVIFEQEIKYDVNDIVLQLNKSLGGAGIKRKELETAFSMIKNNKTFETLINTSTKINGEDGLVSALNNELNFMNSNWDWFNNLDNKMMNGINSILSQNQVNYKFIWETGDFGIRKESIRVVKTAAKQDQNNQKILDDFYKKYPCIEGDDDITDISVIKNSSGSTFFKFKYNDDGNYYAINTHTGLYFKYTGSRYEKTNIVAKCLETDTTGLDESDLRVVNENLNVKDVAGPSQQSPESQPAASQPAASQPAASQPAASQPAASQPTASEDVMNFQTQLIEKGFGQHLGTTGPNGDGVDGKLGPKTAYAAWALLKRENIIT
jgi:hypothetical protein